MHSDTVTVCLLSVLCSTTLVNAAVLPDLLGAILPSNSGNGPGTFSVTQVPNPDFIPSQVSGTAALLYSYTKHGIEVPDILSGILKRQNQTGSASANPIPNTYDREYLVPVSIGTSPQTLPLDLDTGSSDLWVFSTDTTASQVQGQALYRPSNSSTSKLLSGETWSISYGDGSTSSGIVYSDVVTMGSLSFPTQGVESAKSVSNSFTSTAGCSGLIGLAFDALNTARPVQQKTFMDNIRSKLAAPLFTANLKKGAVGNYNFGYIDNTAYTGSIQYAPVSTARGQWEFIASGYQVGTGAFVTTNIDAIADTGTSLLLLPQSIVSAYWSKVSGAGYNAVTGAYTFPCSATLPNFILGIGSYRGFVPGKYLNYAQTGATTCYGGLQSQGNAPFAILGDILLKAQFVVFDLGNTRVGFANKPTS